MSLDNAIMPQLASDRMVAAVAEHVRQGFRLIPASLVPQEALLSGRQTFTRAQRINRSASTVANNFTTTSPIAMGFQYSSRLPFQHNQALLPLTRDVPQAKTSIQHCG